MKSIRLFTLCVFLLVLVSTSCIAGRGENRDSPDTSEMTLVVDDVTVTVVDVQLRNSVQTYYLMNYPDPDHTYLEVILTIDGLDASPEAILDWGTENISLYCDDIKAELAIPRRVIADDHVDYKVGEEINFNYAYFYSVLRNVDFATCGLTFSDHQIVSLTPFIEILDHSEPTVQLEVKGTVLSGGGNFAYGENAVVGGGTQNSAKAVHTTVSGGSMNVATASHATVGGGRENSAVDFYATVGGGYANTANARDTFVGGGSRNTASGPRSTIGGGIQNQATAPDTTIAGGAYNQVEDDYAFVGGGTRNLATGYASVIGGGAGNVASNDQATVSGGLGNVVDSKYGTVGGGYGNIVSGVYSTVPGGFENQADGAYSFAAGQRAVVTAEHSGVFIFADASNDVFSSVTTNEFAVRATGGVRFVSSTNSEGEVLSGVQLPPGSGSWATLSDQSSKVGFASVDNHEILALVAALPITTWRYLGQDESTRHIGPMAQDFYAAFGLGNDDRYISTVDADGIALAAIQGMYDLFQQQETIIQEQDARLTEIEARLMEIERMNGGQQKPQPEIIHWLGWVLLIGFISLHLWMRRRLHNSGLSRRKP